MLPLGCHFRRNKSCCLVLVASTLQFLKASSSVWDPNYIRASLAGAMSNMVALAFCEGLETMAVNKLVWKRSTQNESQTIEVSGWVCVCSCGRGCNPVCAPLRFHLSFPSTCSIFGLLCFPKIYFRGNVRRERFARSSRENPSVVPYECKAMPPELFLTKIRFQGKSSVDVRSDSKKAFRWECFQDACLRRFDFPRSFSERISQTTFQKEQPRVPLLENFGLVVDRFLREFPRHSPNKVFTRVPENIPHSHNQSAQLLRQLRRTSLYLWPSLMHDDLRAWSQ